MPVVLSVLLPVFNGAPFVKSAVDSVLSQTFRDFELLIVDDGSTDESRSILEKLAVSDARIRLMSRANRGLVETLNQLLEMATGSLIARMDADDLCRPSRFERQIAYLNEHPECVAVGCRSLFVDPEGWPIVEFSDKYTHEQIDRALMAPEIGILHPTLMARREAMHAVGGYRAEFPHVEDLDLLLRLGEAGRLANLPDVLLEYRNHLSSVSHRHSVAQSEAGREAVREACRRRGLPWKPEIHSKVVTGPETRAELHRKWAWWALGAGNLPTAKKHALLALRSAPATVANWRLLASVLRA